MFTSIVREFTDRIVDELAPPTTAEIDSGESTRLACRLGPASTVGADDAVIRGNHETKPPEPLHSSRSPTYDRQS